MIIYQVVYYSQFSERVADFGFYEDKLDAEQRAFEVRMKTPVDSGKVEVEEVFVHDSSHKKEMEEAETETEKKVEKPQNLSIYELKPHN